MDLSKYKGLLIAGGVLFAIFTCLISTYGYFNGIRSQNRQFEIDASTQYLACQDNLSATMVAFNDKFGILNFTLSGMDQFVQDAVSGRYDNVNEGGESTGTINTSLLIKAVVEAYPDTVGITDFAREFSTWAGARRESFSQCQQQLLGIFNAWDKWRSQDMIRDSVTGMMGFPDEKLEAKVGTNVFHGQDAWDKMHQLILVKSALDAYNTGELPNQPIPTRIP